MWKEQNTPSESPSDLADLSRQQDLNLTLLCADDESDPTIDAYTAGLLSIEWRTPSACPQSEERKPEPSGGMGFFGFIKVVFWLSLLGLILYFAIGKSR